MMRKNILIPGSPTLVRSLLREGLLDELDLFDETIDHLALNVLEDGQQRRAGRGPPTGERVARPGPGPVGATR